MDLMLLRALLVGFCIGSLCGIAVCAALFKYHRRPKSKSYYKGRD